MKDLVALVPDLLALSMQAGDAITERYHADEPLTVESKSDDTPLTRADLDAHTVLSKGLRALTPGIPLLSEESPDSELAQRREWHKLWLVDPLDGTKEFIGRTGEFTVNIALIDDHRPVLGVLYVPLERSAYVGIPGLGAWRYRCQKDGTWRRTVIRTRALQDGHPLLVLASRRHNGPGIRRCLSWLENHWGPIARSNSGSALKFCHMAEGDGDFYPRFSPCSEWDTGAGQALLEGAGGCLLGMDGAPLRYNERKTLLSPHFYAIADPGHTLWKLLLGRNADAAG